MSLRRRTVLAGLLGLGGLALAPLASLWPRRARAALAEDTLRALETSPYVYVSPLRSDGSESTCHGEVWYAWLDGRAVIITARDRWKAQALTRGLDRARLWVGDYGRWKRLGIVNDDFRQGPSFTARAERITDPAVLDALLVAYERKYPDEIGEWRDRFREGFASGERVLIGYTPLEAEEEGAGEPGAAKPDAAEPGPAKPDAADPGTPEG